MTAKFLFSKTGCIQVRASIFSPRLTGYKNELNLLRYCVVEKHGHVLSILVCSGFFPPPNKMPESSFSLGMNECLSECVSLFPTLLLLWL